MWFKFELRLTSDKRSIMTDLFGRYLQVNIGRSGLN